MRGAWPWPMRWTLPFLLAGLSLLASAWIAWFQHREYAEAVEREEIQRLKDRLTIEQTRLEVQLGQRNLAQVRAILSGLGLRRHLQHAWLIAPDGQVAAALSRIEIGVPWSTIHSRLTPQLAQALEAPAPPAPILHVRRLAESELLVAQATIRPGHRLIVVSDLALPLAERLAGARSILLTQSLAPFLLALTLGILLHGLWLRRAARLARAAEALGTGDFSSRAALSGSDELAHLGVAFDRMAERIATQHTHILRLASLIEHSPLVAIVWRNAPGWPVEFVSDNISRWGFEKQDLLSGRLQYADLIHPDDLPAITADVEQHLAHGPDRYVQTYRLRDGFGHWRWIEDHTWLLRDESGAVVSIQGVLLDISAHREAEVALRLKTQELIERNAELERFAQATIDRELQMLRLKQEINELSLALGRAPPYRLPEAADHEAGASP
ncbi:MAG: PAS domain-containing protein [Rhodocyclaceae bacterium]|nr:PAS domain-containing protein [Rhodocyclaceae bacterium]